MQYITPADLTARFGQDEINGLIESGVSLEQCISDANALADSYVGAVHTLPLPAVPASLTGPVCDIARFFAYKDSPSETIRARYEDALKFLRSVALREITLNLPASDEPSGDEDAFFEANCRLFTRKSLRGF